MAIVFENADGWIICHKSFIQKLYETCIDEQFNLHQLRIKKYFQILTPILTNSAARKKSENDGNSNLKQKKKNPIVQHGEYHLTVEPIIKQGLKTMIELGKNMELFLRDDPSSEEWFSNNDEARQAAKEINLRNRNPDLYETFSTLYYEDIGNMPVITTFNNEQYVLPPLSTFLLSDIKEIDKLIGKEYDVILMDPPWENKSVKRKKGYSWLNCDDLLTLPITELSKHGTLVIVWTTNNEGQLKFVKEKLFPHWHIQHVADWHWIKVTQRGTPVHSFDSSQNKPYENLILGYCQKLNNQPNNMRHIENHKVIISVPSSIHSHKPPLTEILKQYIPENAKCLELFARYLLPGWTSCGNEVLKLQSIKMFEEL